MKMSASNLLSASCEDVLNAEKDHTKIHTTILLKIPHKICPGNHNESPVGLSISANNSQMTENILNDTTKRYLTWDQSSSYNTIQIRPSPAKKQMDIIHADHQIPNSNSILIDNYNALYSNYKYHQFRRR